MPQTVDIGSTGNVKSGMLKKILSASIPAIISCALLVILFKAIIYMNDTKCYLVRATAEGQGGSAISVEIEVPSRRFVDPSIREIQKMIPKEFDITSMETHAEGRGWFCHN